MTNFVLVQSVNAIVKTNSWKSTARS